MPFSQDSLSASSIVQENTTPAQKQLKTLANAARGTRWVATQGHLEKASLWQSLVEPIKGWMGFADRSKPELIEYELIRFLSEGAVQQSFKREDLYLIKLAARQAGLIRGIERSEKNHIDLAALINLIAKQILEHQTLPSECYQAYAGRFYHNHKDLLKPLTPPPYISLSKAVQDKELFFSRRNQQIQEDESLRSHPSVDAFESQIAVRQEIDLAPIISKEEISTPKEIPESIEEKSCSIKLEKKEQLPVDRPSSFLERKKKIITYLALGALAGIGLYRCRQFLDATLDNPIIVEEPSIPFFLPTPSPNIQPPIIPLINVTKIIPSPFTSFLESVSLEPAIEPSLKRISKASLSMAAGMCTALFFIIKKSLNKRKNEESYSTNAFSESLLSREEALDQELGVKQSEFNEKNTDGSPYSPSTEKESFTLDSSGQKMTRQNAVTSLSGVCHSLGMHVFEESYATPEALSSETTPVTKEETPNQEVLHEQASYDTSVSWSSKETISVTKDEVPSQKVLHENEKSLNALPTAIVPSPSSFLTRTTSSPSLPVSPSPLSRKEFKMINDDRIRDYNRRLKDDPVADKLKKALDAANEEICLRTNASRTWSKAKIDSKEPSSWEEDKNNEFNKKIGIAWLKGKRPDMEDAHLATHIEVNGTRYPLFAIFDGHGGDSCSCYLEAYLPDYIAAELPKALAAQNPEIAIYNMLKLAFVKLTDDYRKAIYDLHVQHGITDEGDMDFAGSTATAVLVINGSLYTANIGDTRAIISTPQSVIALSKDAKPEIEKFKRGVEKRGGRVIKSAETGWIYRVVKEESMLAIARAAGHHEIRSAVNPRSEITKYSLDSIPESSFLVIACDGLWDVTSSAQVSHSIQKFAKENCEPTDMAIRLIQKAYNNRSKDNISALVLDLSFLKNK